MARQRAADPWAEAIEHLVRVDDRWRPRIELVGPCGLRRRAPGDRFGTLIRSIVSQQISTQAALSINRRLEELAGVPYRPEAILGLDSSQLRAVGLSARKVEYARALSAGVRSGEVPLSRMGRWSDERIVECLTELPGIGVWTAQMFLIFSLNRPDVLPSGDLGIRAGLQRHFGLDSPPAPRACNALAEPWRPFRTIAMWYLWREIDVQRQARATAPKSPTHRKVQTRS